MQKQEKLLREYISVLLKEEDAGSGSDSSTGSSGYADTGFYMGYGGMGYGGGGGSSTLLKPIKDVLQVFKGALKTLFKSVSYLAKVGLSAALQILSANLFEANFRSLRSNYLNDISRVRSQYSQSVSDSYRAFLSSDLGAMAFFYNPSLFSLTSVTKAFVEAKIVSEDKSKSKKMVAQAKVSTQGAVDSYFENIKNTLSNLSSFKTLNDLPIDDKTLMDLQNQLDSTAEKDKIDKQKAEKELLKALRLQSITRQIEFLKKEKTQIIKTLRDSGASDEVIMHPAGLVARYDQEIRNITSML